MHPEHERQVNRRYQPQSTKCWQAQLTYAIHAALTTTKDAASYWVEEAENLIGRVALAGAGGTFRDAVKFCDPSVQCPSPTLSPAAESGFEPGSFGFHELLDRSCLVAEMFSEHVAQHPASQHPAVKDKICALEQALFDLYNTIGGIE